MTARVEWLPIGHITHGYRRVFSIREKQTLRHVVNLAPMPYETVYRIREMAEDRVEDASLWWGLSVIRDLVSDGTLLGRTNPDTADDGYVQVRPQVPTTKDDLIAFSLYQTILQEGAFVFSH